VSQAAGALVFETDKYYELRSRHLEVLIGGTRDKHRLERHDRVVCKGFATQDLGRYAMLYFRKDDENMCLFHRVSRFNRGSGNWREMNPMLVIAMADQLPTV